MNALIKENREITIEEYHDTIAEIESIEQKQGLLLFGNPKYLLTTAGVRAIDYELNITQLPKEATTLQE